MKSFNLTLSGEGKRVRITITILKKNKLNNLHYLILKHSLKLQQSRETDIHQKQRHIDR